MLLAADPGEPDGRPPARLLLEGERPLPEITEALIGACYLHLRIQEPLRGRDRKPPPRISWSGRTR